MTEQPPARRRNGPPLGRPVRTIATDATRDADPTSRRAVAVTPTTEASPASVGKRVGAYILDYLGVNIALAVIGVRSGLLPTSAELMSQDQAYLAGVVSSVVALLYFALLEAAFGRTLAKWLLGIRVMMADGTRATLRATLTRRVLFVAGMLVPLVGALFTFAVPLAALITAIQDEPVARGFHDRWARTVVVDT